MALPELNLITAASMGDLEAVKRLMKLELPGASQRQTLVFAALKDRAACIEALLPICDQEAIDDAFSLAVQDGKISAAKVLLPHVTNLSGLHFAIECSVFHDQREFFGLVLSQVFTQDHWDNPDEWNLPETWTHIPIDYASRFWAWFHEEHALRQRDVLNQQVGTVGSISSRKI